MTALSEPLTDAQLRILGVLVEKQLATPQAYPLTENALLTGCNQSTNRDPVVRYDSAVVRPAMIQLRALGLARRVKRVGERAEKHAHRLEEQLGLSSTAPLAILAMLMLRGPQTPGELRARTQRLTPDTDDAGFEAALEELRDRALAHELPRGPGEKQPRWRQSLGSTDELVADPQPTASGPPSDPATEQHEQPHEPAGPPVPTNRELAAHLAALERRLATLERELGLDPRDGDR
ncbi:MAG: DUF480 domain-containing protein [Nitriliruptoraceae bacterium]|nr:DUF480 domain-containing protein [Nitriliruptoraceae bacterium]